MDTCMFLSAEELKALKPSPETIRTRMLYRVGAAPTASFTWTDPETGKAAFLLNKKGNPLTATELGLKRTTPKKPKKPVGRISPTSFKGPTSL